MMQERAFRLRTDRFNSTESKPHFINERCFGEDFAAWLREKLLRAVASVSEPIQEDWGWCLIATEGKRKFTLSIGILDESIGKVPAEWRVGVEYERLMNGILGLLRPVPEALLDSVGAKLRGVLADEPTFHELQDAS
jgi:hypothetical protein